MRKFTKLLNTLLCVGSLVSTSSCDLLNKNNENANVKFEFDDKYYIGMQEHFYEIRAMERTCTTDFICDLNQAIGSKVFRLNVTMNNLFYVDRNDTVKFNTSTKEQMRTIVDKLVASGVERIVYATDSFIYPYGYSVTHTISVPDPYSEKDAYIRWLKVNATGYGMMAAEFPEINYFEPINEPDIPLNEVLCKNGMLWGTQNSEFMYSEVDEANILADLGYYISREIKKVNSNNKMMTAALSSLSSTYDYLEYFYKAIESGAHPVGDNLPCSVDPDDYFDIVDLHPYSFAAENVDPTNPKEEGVNLITDAYIEACQKFYDICVAHGDAEKPHWYTETGYTDNGLEKVAAVAGRETAKQLTMIREKLPFVETLIFYKMTDLHEYSVSLSEDNFGLLTALADPYKPLQVKPIMAAIYSYMHNGSTDYSSIDAVRAKYIEEFDL